MSSWEIRGNCEIEKSQKMKPNFTEDENFGSSIKDNECSNFEVDHVYRFESRDLVEAT